MLELSAVNEELHGVQFHEENGESSPFSVSVLCNRYQERRFKT